MTEESWGPWIDHDGRGLPNKVLGQYIEIEDVSIEGKTTRSEGLVPANFPFSSAAILCWNGGGWYKNTRYAKPIIRYRIRQFSAMAALTRIAENPEPPKEVEPVDFTTNPAHSQGTAW